MITILPKHFIAEGVCQECFLHPNDNNLCVKISKNSIDIPRLSNERNYYLKLNKKKINDNDYQIFTKFYGAVETNLGTGYVFDLIRDETTGEVSKTLEYYLLDPDSKIDLNKLDEEFKRLVQLMVKYKIVANDIRAKNICCKILKDQTVQLILVDGLGHRDFIPMVNWFSVFAKMKIERRLDKFKLYNLDVHRNYLKTLYGKALIALMYTGEFQASVVFLV